MKFLAKNVFPSIVRGLERLSQRAHLCLEGLLSKPVYQISDPRYRSVNFCNPSIERNGDRKITGMFWLPASSRFPESPFLGGNTSG